MKIPPLLLTLDVLGAILLGLGLAVRFVSTELIPTHLRFPNDDIAMMLAGVVLMAPMLKHVINQAKPMR